jgi:hypothetical protein
MTFGEEINCLSGPEMVHIANKCIDAGLVKSMDPVKIEEGIELSKAVKMTLKADANAQAKADDNMPELAGSVKQVLWANEIRAKAIASSRLFRQEVMRNQDMYAANRLDLYMLGMLCKERKARWYIDNRREFYNFSSIIKMGAPSVHYFKAEHRSIAELSACEEMTIHPKVKAHTGMTEVCVTEHGLEVQNPLDDDFVKVVMKHRLRWHQDQQAWIRRLDENSESASNQIEELATSLLTEGFPVMVSNAESRRKVAGFKDLGSHATDPGTQGA